MPLGQETGWIQNAQPCLSFSSSLESHFSPPFNRCAFLKISDDCRSPLLRVSLALPRIFSFTARFKLQSFTALKVLPEEQPYQED